MVRGDAQTSERKETNEINETPETNGFGESAKEVVVFYHLEENLATLEN